LTKENKVSTVAGICLGRNSWGNWNNKVDNYNHKWEEEEEEDEETINKQI
jgi:hypothetical protein